MNRAFLHLSLMLIIVLMLACTKNDVVSQISLDISKLMPLAKGNTWNYVDTTFNSDKTFEAQPLTLTSKGEITMDHQGDEVIGTHLVWEEGNTKNPVSRLVRINNKGGLDILAGLSKEDTIIVKRKRTFYDFPVESGDTKEAYFPSYNINFKNFTVDTITVTCKSESVNLKTPYKTLECLSYTYSFKEIKDSINNGTTISDTTILKITDYFAPGIGLVGSEHKVGSKIIRKQLLVKFSLKD